MAAPAPTAVEAAHSVGITAEEAAQSLERDRIPGLLEVEDAPAGGVRTYCLRNRVGILAHGSLRADPGPGLKPYVERRIALTTPFPVEYVRSSATHAGAPVLVLVLAPEVDRATAGVLLQQRKLDRASDDIMWFTADRKRCENSCIRAAFVDGCAIDRSVKTSCHLIPNG